jgi:HEAT repeat protein
MAVEDYDTLDADTLIGMLGHADNGVRVSAALALGKRKERRAVDALIKLLDDNATVWSAGSYAAWALGEINDKRAVEPLISALDKQFVSGKAIESLVKLRDDRALDPLIHLFERKPTPSLATVLGNWGDRRAVEPLIATMTHPDQHVRFYVARALGKLGDSRALSVLEWARDHDTTPITDTESMRGKSVSYVAAKAIEKIKMAAPSEPLA